MTAPRPLQNRVDPFGAILATRERGVLMGNRGGRLHDDEKRLTRRRWTSRRWIACVCAFKGRRREVFGPGYTELFFRDEPTALAAGHRPCFECRRAEAVAFQHAFPGGGGADAMDARLHTERLDEGRLRQPVKFDALPDGAMVLWRDAPHLVAGGRLRRWSFGAYGPPQAPDGEMAALTPASILAAMRGGYRPRREGWA